LVDDANRQLFGHPPVTLAEQTDEVRPAAIDLRQADRQHRTLGLLFVGDTPTKVDLRPRDTALLAHPTQLREDLLDQLFPLGLHVAERRRNEDADRSEAVPRNLRMWHR